VTNAEESAAPSGGHPVAPVARGVEAIGHNADPGEAVQVVTDLLIVERVGEAGGRPFAGCHLQAPCPASHPRTPTRPERVNGA